MVRALQLAAIRAILTARYLQGVVRATHVAARLGDFFLRNRHGRDLSCLCAGPVPNVARRVSMAPNVVPEAGKRD